MLVNDPNGYTDITCLVYFWHCEEGFPCGDIFQSDLRHSRSLQRCQGVAHLLNLFTPGRISSDIGLGLEQRLT